MSTTTGPKESPNFTEGQMSSPSCSMVHSAIQHQHHHHFYSHPQSDPSSSSLGQHAHHHLHHHHFQTQTQTSNTSLSESTISSPDSRCCSSCRCSNRLLTGIVITILPIAITSTLICVFMMQKTNLHQYAIYSFVIFCVAFVFPFALFFFTVILNKIYKFYKREIRSIPPSHLNSLVPENCDVESSGHMSSAGYSLQSAPNANSSTNLPVPGRALLLNNNSCQAGTGQSASLICYSSRAYHPYYYHIEDGTIVAYAPDNSVIIDDSPPSYEMALLCPSVTHQQYPGAIINAPIQVILPKEQCKEKNAVEISLRSEPTRESLSQNELTTADNDHEEHDDNVNSAHHSSDDSEPKSVDSGQDVAIPTG